VRNAESPSDYIEALPSLTEDGGWGILSFFTPSILPQPAPAPQPHNIFFILFSLLIFSFDFLKILRFLRE
jgi:hypothetical protein